MDHDAEPDTASTEDPEADGYAGIDHDAEPDAGSTEDPDADG